MSGAISDNINGVSNKKNLDLCRPSRKRQVTAGMAFAEFLENRDLIMLLAPYWFGDNFTVQIIKFRSRRKRKYRVSITGTQPILDDQGRATREFTVKQAKGEGVTLGNAARNAVQDAMNRGLFTETIS